MSKAFTKEPDGDEAGDDLPERPVSEHPNFVTAEGLRAIDGEVARLRAELAAVQGDADRTLAARLARDLRYWTQRRATAQLVDPPVASGMVQFGSRVTIERQDGRRQTFRIVGEDEADPARGSISHVSPMGAALLRQEEGDVVLVAGGEVEIVAVE
ncbi:transcription elongation factor GreB [Allostella vacuolata]|nr:transcription elongation factor GreB [Stella vacuolata]